MTTAPNTVETCDVDALRARFLAVREHSAALAAPLSDADATAQSMPDASPAKWHLAHSSWFFETFVLASRPGYRPFDPDFAYLFNSYYEAAGPRHCRARRGMLTRPDLARVMAYRRAVEVAVLDTLDALPPDMLARVELGLNHEEQHQELLLSDILHLFSENPLGPVYAADAPVARAADLTQTWHTHDGGVVSIGSSGGFGFDCEAPAHQCLLTPFAISSRLVSNGEWCAFIDDGGYRRAEHWLSDGWAWVQENGISAPLYWSRGKDGERTQFSLRGWQPLTPGAPVQHISYFEADAFASWADTRLPREGEWEVMARRGTLDQLYDSAWQWTQSAFAAYPGFAPATGAIGEYNGKFMSGQFVLRGGSCATPAGHSRASYRNFYYPHQRWLFGGVRLAKDA